MKKNLFLFSLLAVLMPCLVMSLQAKDENLLKNGDFEKGSSWPSGWAEPKEGGSLEKEDENKFVRITTKTKGQENILYIVHPVHKDEKAYRLSFRVRVDNLKLGEEAWFDARVIANFKDDSGEKYDSPAPVPFRKDSKKWVEKSIEFKVPEGATKLEILAGLFRVESGTMDIDDIVLVAIDPGSVK